MDDVQGLDVLLVPANTSHVLTRCANTRLIRRLQEHTQKRDSICGICCPQVTQATESCAASDELVKIMRGHVTGDLLLSLSAKLNGCVGVLAAAVQSANELGESD